MSAVLAQAHIDAIETVLLAPLPDKPIVVWARWSTASDVLLLLNAEREVECVGCAFVHDGEGSYVTDKLHEAIGHLAKHRQYGHVLPRHVEDLIRADWKVHFDV